MRQVGLYRGGGQTPSPFPSWKGGKGEKADTEQAILIGLIVEGRKKKKQKQENK